MHDQLSVPFKGKLDAPLADLCNRGVAAPHARMPLIVRYRDDGDIEDLVARIVSLGGQVRHRLQIIEAVAIWLPIEAFEQLAREENVEELELDQEFTVA